MSIIEIASGPARCSACGWILPQAGANDDPKHVCGDAPEVLQAQLAANRSIRRYVSFVLAGDENADAQLAADKMVERVEQAEREREAAIRDRDAAQKEANKYAADLMVANGELAQLDAARAQVKALREALAPFAACGAIWKKDSTPDTHYVHWSQRGWNIPELPDAGISVGDLRKAYDALRDTEPHGRQ